MGLQATATYTDRDLSTQLSTGPASGRQTRQVRLAALPSAVPWARRVLRHMLTEWQLESIADTAALLVSELVTNAVDASAAGASRDHGTLPMIGLTLRLTADSLALEVWDSSPLRPVRQEADSAADHGRGLVLVDALADAWGDRAADGGKVVWCEVAIPARPAALGSVQCNGAVVD
jgi:anti-sigma regulatory factor (Ser/Thr protein kinase)